MAKKRAARTKKKRRRGRGGTSTLPGARRAEPTAETPAAAVPDPVEDDPWMAQQREIDRLKRDVDQALAHHEAGRIADAEVGYRAVLESDPFHFDALRLLAAARLGQGDPAGAVELFDRVAGVGPLDAGMHSNRGFALKELGRIDEAIEACEAAIQAEPEHVDGHFNLGACLLSAGRHPEAVEAFDWIIERHPDHADAWYNKGRALTMQALHEESVAAYERAVDLNPSKINYLLRLGMARQNAGDQWDAARAYDRVLAMDPNNHTAYFLLGHSQYDQGYTHEAVDAYRKAVELKPDYVEALSNLGSVLRRSGEREEARDAFVRAVQAAPAHVPAHFNLANLEREYGAYDQAESGYREVLRLQPDHFGAHVNLSSSLLALGRPDEAAEVAREGVKITTAPDPELGWNQLAAALLAGGDVDGALEAWDRALEARGEDRYSLCSALATPVVLEGRDDRDEVGEVLAEVIEEQAAAGLQLSPLAKAFDVSPADLSGHGRDDQALLGQLETLFRGIDEELSLVASHCHEPRSDPDAPLRIGLVSSSFSDPDDGLLALGLARAIPRERASVQAFALGEPLGELGRQVLEAADEAHVLPRDFIMTRNRLCEATLDVLIHVGPTRSSLGYFLAFVQAARVQVGLGFDGRCGLSTLADLPTERSPLSMSRPPAGEAGESDGARYVCSRPLRDVGPEFDALAKGVLEADASAQVVIRSHGAKYADDALLERMQGAGVPVDRIRLEPAGDLAALTALFAGAAAILEPPGFGHLPTTALALASGRPTLALAGSQAALPGVVVADDEERYVAQAVEQAVGGGGAAAEIDGLWDDDAGVIELMDALDQAVRAAN